MRLGSSSLIFTLLSYLVFTQPVDLSLYEVTIRPEPIADQYFKNDRVWRGADGAGSIDLGDGRVLWLFGDSLISGDGTGERNGTMVKNSVAIQKGFNFTAPVNYHWRRNRRSHSEFFPSIGKTWFWPGHGIMIDKKLVIFLFQVRGVEGGLGFEPFHWYAAFVSNPRDEPANWKIDYLRGVETFGIMAGSGAVLKYGKHLYAYSAVSPMNDVYLLRWDLENAARGDLSRPQWWLGSEWGVRRQRRPVPTPLFRGQTEFSVHYDPRIRKFVLVQSEGFGEAAIAIRLAERPEGPWTEPHTVFRPDYKGIQQPFMYSAKSHPELKNPNGVYVTYNVNSFDFFAMLKDQNLYFPKFVTLQIKVKE